MTAPTRPRLSAVQRITILGLVLLAVGVLLVAYAATARRAAETGAAVASDQVLLDRLAHPHATDAFVSFTRTRETAVDTRPVSALVTI